MNENPLSSHMLKVLITLLDEESVTKAAKRMALSQPATSVLLRQLRATFNDPLLVRSGNGMVRTERGEYLRIAARKVMVDLNDLILDPDNFNPSVSRATFTVAMPDHILPQIFNGVMQEFRSQAPLAKLSIRSITADYDFMGALTSGRDECVISSWPGPPADLRTAKLFEDKLVCLVDPSHPFVFRSPTLEDYLEASHIATPDYATIHQGVIETYLSESNLTRKRLVTVENLSMAPYLVPGTDLVYTVARHFAEHLTRFLPLKIVPAPIVCPPVLFSLLWHERMQYSPKHLWLRRLITSIMRFNYGPQRQINKALVSPN